MQAENGEMSVNVISMLLALHVFYFILYFPFLSSSYVNNSLLAVIKDWA